MKYAVFDENAYVEVSSMSVSKISCKLVLRGKGELELGLYRHLAPITINAIVRSLPIVGRVTIYPKAMICLLTDIRTGVEKQKFEYGRGDVAFLAASGTMCFFTANVKSDRPLNPVGKVDRGIELFERVSAGDVIEIRAGQEAAAQT